MLGKKQTQEARTLISAANKGRPSWNKGGENTWTDKIVESRLRKYDHEIMAEHLNGQVLRFSHPAAAARGLGISRESVRNVLLGHTHRVRSGWTFRRVDKVE